LIGTPIVRLNGDYNESIEKSQLQRKIKQNPIPATGWGNQKDGWLT